MYLAQRQSRRFLRQFLIIRKGHRPQRMGLLLGGTTKGVLFGFPITASGCRRQSQKSAVTLAEDAGGAVAGAAQGNGTSGDQDGSAGRDSIIPAISKAEGIARFIPVAAKGERMLGIRLDDGTIVPAPVFQHHDFQIIRQDSALLQLDLLTGNGLYREGKGKIRLGCNDTDRRRNTTRPSSNTPILNI